MDLLGVVYKCVRKMVSSSLAISYLTSQQPLIKAKYIILKGRLAKG